MDVLHECPNEAGFAALVSSGSDSRRLAHTDSSVIKTFILTCAWRRCLCGGVGGFLRKRTVRARLWAEGAGGGGLREAGGSAEAGAAAGRGCVPASMSASW